MAGVHSPDSLPSFPLRRRRAVDREALEYLRREVEPALRKEHLERAARAVMRSAEAGRVSGLGRLPERERRALLQAIEERLGSGPAPSPAAVVRLTAVLASPPDEVEQPYPPVALPVR